METMIDSYIQRARAAQKTAEDYTQAQVLELARAIALTAIRHADEWANDTMEETKLGDIQSKIGRINDRPRGVMRDLLNAKTVGVIEEDKEKGIVKIAKPVGVVGAIVPMTVPESVPIIKGMNAIMGRNAVIFSPHPRAKKITFKVVEAMRETMRACDAPEDLFLCIEEPTHALSNELMQKCDLIIATGGSSLVKAAYNSGTPAYGVGVGNAVSVIDETADLKDAAHKIMESQVNDLATGCSTENELVIQRDVYDEFMACLAAEKGYLLNTDEKARLQQALWVDGHLNGQLICRPAAVIAAAAGISIPDGTKFILVEETGIGPDYPFSGEKLSVVLTCYQYDTFDQAIQMVNEIQSYSGAGHSCGIHSFNQEHIDRYCLLTKTSRVMINSPQNKANAGSFKNGMPFTISLGCGTWGGNNTTDNINYRHYINTTWVATWNPDGTAPSDEILFGKDMLAKFGM